MILTSQQNDVQNHFLDFSGDPSSKKHTKKSGSGSLSYGFSSFMTEPLSYGAPYSYDIQVPHMAQEIQD